MIINDDAKSYSIKQSKLNKNHKEEVIRSDLFELDKETNKLQLNKLEMNYSDELKKRLELNESGELNINLIQSGSDIKSAKIFILNKNKTGGSWKFTTDIVEEFTKYNLLFKYVNNKNCLNNISNKDIIFIQYLWDYDFDINFILNLRKKFGCRIIISLHDFYWLLENTKDLYNKNLHNKTQYCHNKYLINDIRVNHELIRLFENASNILYPSNFVFNIYSKFFQNCNFTFIQRGDFKEEIINNICYKNVTNELKIGILHTITRYKGQTYYNKIFQNIKNINNIKISYIKIIYNENNWLEKLNEFNVHCLIILNEWSETYCWALSKYFFSGLPIIYNKTELTEERISSKKMERFFCIDDINSIESIKTTISNAINFLKQKATNGNIVNLIDDKKLYYDEKWLDLFLKN